ncbi:TetR/AcrR family transcriptional regulator [Sphingomonas koreensis]|nr:TetR/AcrR family transcriptional regulator [Sphingomonas koreensis]
MPADDTTRVPRTNDPERTRANIVAVATEEFAKHGLSGARVDRIAEQTHTSKRMLYYYFKSKEGLYRAVLYSYYEKLRSAEANLELGAKTPMIALRELVEFTFDYHVENAETVRLVLVENIHRGENIEQMPLVDTLNSAIIASVKDICDRGAASGEMRDDLDPFELYTSIAALCFFNVSNRYTIRAIFGHDLGAPDEIAMRREAIVQMVQRYARADG